MTKLVKMEVMKFVYALMSSEYWFKHNLGKIRIFVYLHLAHRLIVCNINWKHITPIVMKKVFEGLTCNSSVLKAVYVREFGDLKKLVYQETKFSLLV